MEVDLRGNDRDHRTEERNMSRWRKWPGHGGKPSRICPAQRDSKVTQQATGGGLENQWQGCVHGAGHWCRHLPDVPLQQTSMRLQTYSGEPLPVIGQVQVEVKYGQQQANLPLTVVKGGGPSLFGRDWLASIQLDWQEIHNTGQHPGKCVESKRVSISGRFGDAEGYQAKIYIDTSAKPRFCRARTVPYALRTKVEEELDRLEKEYIIEPVQFADWAAPIVPVLKSDRKSVRLCGDFKLTINQASKLDRYPIPKIEDLFARMSGGKTFSKLDLSQAYQQVLLEESSKDLAVINTHRGLFRYNRLPFGISVGKIIMVLVDAHSKWIEAHLMSATTATSTIELLRSIFAQFGFPETLVSDNGPQFTSEEFRQFCRRNGIHQVLVAPYHPSSNGLAERAVQTQTKLEESI